MCYIVLCFHVFTHADSFFFFFEHRQSYSRGMMVGIIDLKGPRITQEVDICLSILGNYLDYVS